MRQCYLQACTVIRYFDRGFLSFDNALLDTNASRGIRCLNTQDRSTMHGVKNTEHQIITGLKRTNLKLSW